MTNTTTTNGERKQVSLKKAVKVRFSKRPEANGKLSIREMNKLKKLYTDGEAAFGSFRNLVTASKLPRKKVQHFLETIAAHTKYKQFRKSFPRLSVIAYDINEIWSVDLAYVDKLSKYNDGIKYLMVTVDVLSRFVRVGKLKSKDSEEASKIFQQLIANQKPEKVWVDKGTEFKGAFKRLCDKENISIYSTESETKSAFAERNIRSLKNIIYKHLEFNWTYRYIDHLSKFVSTINHRQNRILKRSPASITSKDVPYLTSLAAEQSVRKKRKPSLKVGHYVRIAKPNIPFRKGYKQNFTDEVFEIEKIATVYPPTYNLIDANKQSVKGKFYEAELVKVSVLNDFSS